MQLAGWRSRTMLTRHAASTATNEHVKRTVVTALLSAPKPTRQSGKTDRAEMGCPFGYEPREWPRAGRLVDVHQR